ncbi:MAG: MBL fold metallo-hydrolase [Gammaproteobacteria bacterium]|nr:MBL fold metallo-hydrolase [Gammaproteobacteria bacterium]
MNFVSVEGNHQRLDGGAMFGNVPRALWSQWLAPDEHNRVELATRGLYVPDLNGQSVLFETGIGIFFEPKLRERFGVYQDEHVLLGSLQDAGTSHDEIDLVVLSHLHFDHAGGLLAPYREGREPSLLFPNARILVGTEAFERARQPHPRDRASFIPALPQLLLDSGRLELVEGEHAISLGDAVRFHYSDGHTPGLMMAQIGGKGGVLFCSDLMPGRPWVHLPVTMGYDRNPELLIDEKQRILELVIELKLKLFFEHDPECSLATVTRDGRGRHSAVAAGP